MPEKSNFDWGVFFAGTHEEVLSWQREQVRQMEIHERLRSAGELILRVYGYDPSKPAPGVDRTVFSMRQHANR